MANLPTTYATGTVTVGAGSTTVTGAGTSWIAAGVEAGDIFWAAGLSVRIASVNSATSLTLAYAWPGAALSAANYEVRYTPDITRALASAREVLGQLTNGNLSSVAALATSANKISYYTGQGTAALTDITSAARSLLGSTCLSVTGGLPEFNTALRIARAANSAANGATTPQDGLVLQWAEGVQDLGTGEGLSISWLVKLIDDLEAVKVGGIELRKTSNTDSSRLSDLAIRLSSTGLAADLRDVLLVDAATGRVNAPLGLRAAGVDVLTGAAYAPGDAIAPLGAYLTAGMDTSLVYKGRITAGDLNNYCEPGIWRINSAGDAGAILNVPAALSGSVLEVISPDLIRARGSLALCIQRFTARYSGGTQGRCPRVWLRQCNNITTGDWGPWVEQLSLVESGSNANGTYLRLSSGLQICRHDLDAGSTIAYGTGTRADPYSSTDFTWTFPAAFTTAPAVEGSCRADANAGARHHFFVYRYLTATNISGARAVRFSDSNGAMTAQVSLLAIGNWF